MARDRYISLIDYCERMSMTYSYKPVLILGLIRSLGSITLDEAAFFSCNSMLHGLNRA